MDDGSEPFRLCLVPRCANRYIYLGEEVTTGGKAGIGNPIYICFLHRLPGRTSSNSVFGIRPSMDVSSCRILCPLRFVNPLIGDFQPINLCTARHKFPALQRNMLSLTCSPDFGSVRWYSPGARIARFLKACLKARSPGVTSNVFITTPSVWGTLGEKVG